MSKSTANGSGPLKPKIRKKSREPRSRSPKKSAALEIEQELDDLDQQFSVRVRERGPDSPPDGRPRSRLGALLRDPSPSAIKESIKRPLSGLLKRPGSRASSRERKPSKGDIGKNDLELDDGTASIANGVAPGKKNRPKSSLFGGGDNRPGTAFGRRFSFGRKGKSSKKADATEEPDDLDDDDLGLETPMNQRRGIVELPDSDAPRGRTSTESPDIPNLEEVDGAAFGLTVAEAPSVAVNRVSTYRELDSELMKHAAFAALEDIDLSLLTKFLCPESEVSDEKVPWTWDYLYTNICSELRTEWDEEGEDDEEEGFSGQDLKDQRNSFEGNLGYSRGDSARNSNSKLGTQRKSGLGIE